MNEEKIKEYLKPGRKNIILIYILYLSGFLFPILPLIGAAFAYANKSIPDKLPGSHYLFAFRTFCFGVAGFVVAFITSFIFIGLVLYVLVMVWAIVRSVIALQLVIQGSPHPDPLTFWIK